MQTVEAIVKGIFGRQTVAAEELGVKPASISNWKAWGYFPARMVGPILKRARERGIEISVDDIPATPEKVRRQ